MRALRLIAAFLTILASPQIAPSAGASTVGTFTVACASAAAGSDAVCTVSRTSGGKGIYVYIQTSDGSAMAGMDYTPVKQLLYFQASKVAASVPVHTVANPSATGTLTFNVAIAAGSEIARTTASIVESVPAPVPPPTPAPGQQWVSAPLTNDGYARCKLAGGCHPFGPGYPDPVAQQGDVMAYAWNGCDGAVQCRAIGVFWPIGHDPRVTKLASDWQLGVEGYADEWEGVAPAP